MKISVVVMLTTTMLAYAHGQVDTSTARNVARVTIECASDSAMVFIDDVCLGMTPLSIDTLSEGTHIVRLFQSRPSNWYAAAISDSILVKRGESREHHYSFPSTLTIPPPGQPVGPDLFETGFGRISPSRLYISGGTAIVAGGISAYFKIRADNSHDAYLLTGDPAKKDEYHRFDTISAISLIVAQTGLALFAYFLISE